MKNLDIRWFCLNCHIFRLKKHEKACSKWIEHTFTVRYKVQKSLFCYKIIIFYTKNINKLNKYKLNVYKEVNING
jgi:hypothetical protein